MASGTATVKMVLSGDTVVLMGRAVNGPPPELQLSLSSLIAPKLARGPQSAEEPFGWASREFLRNLVLGQLVSFKVDYRVQSINRDFGTITLNGESVSRAVAREGWARVKSAGQSRDGEISPEYDELVKLEAEASAAKRGLFSDERQGATREVAWNVDAPEELLQKLKGKPTRVLIEYVRDGASFRAIVLDGFNYINLSLAGVACPRVNAPTKAAAGTPAEGKPEPHALEARYFTEVRLLQREVEVVIEGIDKYGTFYGTVLHPKGNISVELLKTGLARVVDYSIGYTSRDNALQYRLAERQAKSQQLKIWAGYVPQAAPSGTREYHATVIEVVSGDTVVVKVDKDGSAVGEERKLSLSSLRAPRQGSAKSSNSGEPWAAEAKEALRSRLVGRAVTVTVDYEREIPIGEKKEKRAFASLYMGKGSKKKSVSESLVADGFAQVIRHRADEERAENYDDLVVAETAAKAGKKGIHSTETPPIPRITDLSLDSKKARTHLPFFQRQGDLRAIVEYVFAGSRFKIYLPSENCSIMMALASIRTPSPGKAGTEGGQRGRTGEPFGEEAKAFTRQNLLQRTVEVEIRDMDKNGVALGNVTVVTPGGERAFYGTELVRHGLARVDDRGASLLPTAITQSLQAAQELAQHEKAGIWSLEPEVKEEETAAPVPEELVDVTVSEIVDGTHCFLHYTKDDGLSVIEAKMKAFAQDAAGSKLTFEPRKGSVVAALFDDTWYRARVEEKTAKGFKVLYIDYGNRATVTLDQIRNLDTSYTGLAAQAHEASLAFLKAPSLEEEFGEAAAIAFSRLAWGKPLQARVHAKDGAKVIVSLYDAANPGSTSIGKALVEEGLARVSKRSLSLLRRLPPTATTLADELKEAQETARRSRLNMWHYGDLDDSDDERY